MSRWESPTFNSCLVNNSLKVEFLPFGVGSAPQGGTQHFSHHAFAITGAEVPAWSREHAWRFAYFFDNGGAPGSKSSDIRKPLTAEEKKKKEAAAHQAWLAFVEKEAPKRLANRKPLPNDPTAYKEIKPGKSMPDEKFEAWKKEKEQLLLRAKQAEEGELAKIRQDVDKMMEKRTKSNNMAQQKTGDGMKKVPSNKQKALEAQLLLLKKQNNPLAQKVRLRLPKVDKEKKNKNSHLSSSCETAINDSQRTDEGNSQEIGDHSPIRQHKSSQLARSGASIVSSNASNDSMSPSKQTVSSNTSSLAYPPNLLNMANLAQVTRNPSNTPTATAAKALVLEEALDRYAERRQRTTRASSAGEDIGKGSGSNLFKKGSKSKRPEWDDRFNVKPEVDARLKRKEISANKQKRPDFASTAPLPAHLLLNRKTQDETFHTFSNHSKGDLRPSSSEVGSREQRRNHSRVSENSSPPWSGFVGEGDGGDGSGDGVSGEPWNYKEHFASSPVQRSEG